MASGGPLSHLREHPEIVEADVTFVLRRCRRGARVLDIGAGRGTFVNEARRQGLQALALEMEGDAAVLWARERTPGVLGYGSSAPFHDSSFDVVRMKEVLEHVEDPLLLVREARRLLVPGGVLIAHVPTPYSQLYPIANFWDDYTHVRPFSRLALRRLVADAGLELVRIDAYVSGRNPVERTAGKILARILPHIYLAVAVRPDDHEAYRSTATSAPGHATPASL